MTLLMYSVSINNYLVNDLYKCITTICERIKLEGYDSISYVIANHVMPVTILVPVLSSSNRKNHLISNR